MYGSNGQIVDRREMLKIKLKHLAAEARIIRHEERKSKGILRDEMSRHRRGKLRDAARDTHIAYGLIRGRTLDRIEPSRKTDPNWESIDKMIRKYGPRGATLKSLMNGSEPLKAAA